MNLGYKRTRIINSADLPSILAHSPPMDIEFINLVTVDHSRMIGQIVSDISNVDENGPLIKQLASEIIVAVYGQEGERYAIGEDITIDDFATHTESAFVSSVTLGWVMLTSAEMKKKRKRSEILKLHLNSTKAA